MFWIISRSGLCLILPSASRELNTTTSLSGRSSAISLHVKSNSLRPTQSIAGDALSVSVGKTIVCAPTKPILVSGFCALIASATLRSFFSDGVEVAFHPLPYEWKRSRHGRRQTGGAKSEDGNVVDAEFEEVKDQKKSA